MPEGRGFIVLKKEMTDPGERVALDERNGYQPPPLRQDGRGEQYGCNGRAREVQTAADAVHVFGYGDSRDKGIPESAETHELGSFEDSRGATLS